jgi:uncharacterized protein YqeY
MELKERINADYITAFKEKNVIAKSALSGLKAKILEAEKAGPAGTELSDGELFKILLSNVKQRKQSIEAFTNAGRTDLVEQELSELSIIDIYLPKMMTDDEIESALLELVKSLPEEFNKQKVMGMLMGNFNKKYPGLADGKTLKQIVEKITN